LADDVETDRLTRVELDAVRVELREALVSAMDQIVDSVHSVAPPLRSQVRLSEGRLDERLQEIERKLELLTSAIERMTAEDAPGDPGSGW
jgi:hypothetical protein